MACVHLRGLVQDDKFISGNWDKKCYQISPMLLCKKFDGGGSVSMKCELDFFYG